MANQFKDDNTKNYDKIIYAIRSIYPWRKKTKKDITFIQLLLPHLEKITISLEQLFGKSKCGKLISILGDTYLTLGNYDKSEYFFNKKMELQKEVYGSRDIEIAYAFNDIGISALNSGNYVKAKELLEKTLEIKQQFYGIGHPEIYYALYDLGRTYLSQGNFSEAVRLLKRSLVVYRINYIKHIFVYREDKVSNITIIGVLDSLSLAYACLEKYGISNNLLKEAKELVVKIYQEDNIFTVKACASLGNTFRALNINKESKDLLESAYNTLKKFFNYDKLTIAKVKGNLGLLYGNLGDEEKKKEYLEYALEIFKKYLPEEHLDIINTVNELNVTKTVNINFNKNFKKLGYQVVLLP